MTKRGRVVRSPTIRPIRKSGSTPKLRFRLDYWLDLSSLRQAALRQIPRSAIHIVVFLGLHVLRAVLAAIFGMGWWFAGFGNWGVFTLSGLLLNFLSLLSLILWVVLMVKAFQGVRFKLPLAGDIAESLTGRHI